MMDKKDAIDYLLYMKHDVLANSPYDVALDTAIEALKETAKKPKTVRHGRWIEKPPYSDETVKGLEFQIVCSRCDEQNSSITFDENSVPIAKTFYRTKFCPNCGARMDADHIDDVSKKVGGADDGQIWGCNHGTSTKIRRMGEKERRADSF